MQAKPSLWRDFDFILLGVIVLLMIIGILFIRSATLDAVDPDLILVAVGAHPFVPEAMKGCDAIETSNDIFEWESLPKSVVIAGGGYIAVEFAGIFSGLGVETILVYRGEQILRGFDDDIRNHLATEMKKKGIELRMQSDIARIDRSGDGVRVTLNAPHRIWLSAMYWNGRETGSVDLR